MSIITIILFFIYIYGLGFSATFFFRNSDDFFERNLMRMGIGLGVLPLIFVLLNLLHIPIDWRIILAMSLILPVFALVKNAKKGFKLSNINFKKSHIYLIIVLLVFSLTLFMYSKGTFKYPYFEDDDPWAHASGVKYVSMEKNLNDKNSVLKYIEPYPPGYDALFGILHQTSISLMWTMKFFNALIISLGIIFFYFFSKRFMHNSNKAFLATIVLAMIPCYLSHFIWTHSLVMTLLPVALYCLLMIDFDKKWVYPSVLVMSGIPLIQPSQSVKFFIIFAIYLAVKSVYSRRFLIRGYLAVIFGYLASLLWWATNWSFLITKVIKSSSSKLGIESTEVTSNIIVRFWGYIIRTFSYMGGTATRPYTFSDFFVAKSQNMINNPVGVGIVLCLLLLLSLVIILFAYKSMKKEKKIWVITALFWLVFTFLGINSMTFHLPVGLFAFRFWMLFAIPASLIAAEGAWFLVGFFRQLRIPKIATIILLIVLIFLTSGQQKYAVNTAMWGPGQMWTSMEEVAGYVWLKDLPPNTKVFAYSNDEQVIGFDKFSCRWCDEVIDFRKDLLYKNASEVYSWLKEQRYEYLIVDGMAYKNFGEVFGVNETNEILSKRVEEINSFGKFQAVHQTKGMVVFKIA